jgi:NADPH:quinone reductase-like Zn-dependent oxidoreductase
MMRALLCHRYGKVSESLTVGSTAAPVAGPDDIVVRVAASSANAADYRLITGDPGLVRLGEGLFRPRRRVVGADVAGTVTAVGANVTQFQVGDRVAAELADGGAMAEFACAPAAAFARVPDSVPLQTAAACPLAGLTALRALEQDCKVAPGERVLVVGASGGVGSFAIQLAHAFGASRVDAVCGPRSRAAVAGLRVCDRVFDYTTEDYIAETERALTEDPDNAGYDVIVDCAVHRNFSDSRRAMRPKARYTLVGMTPGWSFIAGLLRVRWISNANHIFTSTMSSPDTGSLERILAMVGEGKVRPLVAQTVVGLEAAIGAIDAVANGHPGGKIVVAIEPQDQE